MSDFPERLAPGMGSRGFPLGLVKAPLLWLETPCKVMGSLVGRGPLSRMRRETGGPFGGRWWFTENGGLDHRKQMPDYRQGGRSGDTGL